MPTPAPPAIPDHVLLRRIGVGSYGEVWLARSVIGTPRAVKIVFRSSFEEDRPFEREYAGIQNFEPVSRTHPSQVNILHVGRSPTGDHFYYIMELADDVAQGSTIDPDRYEPHTLRAELKRRGRLPVAACIRLGEQLASALAGLHSRGLIHRDIKPSNIIVVGGVPKLADPGLVALSSGPHSFVGTEGFVPPEGPGSPAADVYSLGKVLYEAATGLDRLDWPRFPEAPPPPAEHRALLELNEVLLRCCDPDPRRRYPDATALEADLAWLRAGRSVRRLHLRRTWRRRVLWGAATAAVCLGLWGAVRDRFPGSQPSLPALATLCRDRGLELLERGDAALAALWLTEALARQPGDADQQRDQRVRIGSLLRHLPALRHAWHHPAPVLRAEFTGDLRQVVTLAEDHGIRLWSLIDTHRPAVLIRPGGAVLDFSLHPDGQHLATAGNDGVLRLWDLATGRAHGAPLAHDAGIRRVRFSADGRYLGTAAADGYARIWSWPVTHADGRRLAHEGAVTDLEFSPDGRWVVTGDAHGSARVWPVEGPPVADRVFPHGSPLVATRLSADGAWLATAGVDQRVRIWNRHTGAREIDDLRPRSPEGAVGTIAFRPQRHSLLVTMNGRRVYQWDTESGYELAGPVDHADRVHSAAYSPDGRWLATAGNDGTARVWDATTGEPAGPPLHHARAVRGIRFSPDGRWLVTADADGWCKVWDGARITATTRRWFHEADVTRARFSRDGRSVATASHDGTVRVWAADTGQPLAKPLTHPGRVRDLHWSADGRRLFTLAGEDQVQVWTPGTLETPPLTFRHGAFVYRLSVDHEGRWVVSTGADGGVRVWQIAEAVTVHPIAADTPVLRATALPEGGTIITASATGSLQAWNPPTHAPLWTLPAPTNVAEMVASPDGRWIAVGNTEGSVMVVDASGGSATAMTPPHHREISALAFSGDGRTVFVGSLDGTLSRWDFPLGTPPRQLAPQNQSIISLSVSADARWLATTSNQDRHTRVLEAHSGRLLALPLPHRAIVYEARFSPVSDSLVSAGADDEAGLWDLSPDDRPVDALRAAAQRAAAAALDPQLNLHPLTADAYARLWTSRPDADDSARARDPEDRTGWHQQQARSAAHAKQWFAAVFHHQRVWSAAGSPSNATASQPLADLEKRWQQFEEGGSDHAGVAARLPTRPANARLQHLDLTDHYNALLDATWQASIPFEGPEHRVDLAELPRGVQVLGGVAFDLRGVVQLGSTMLRLQGLDFPARVNGIRIGQRGRRIHFLHASSWGQPPDGTIVGRIQFHYLDGRRRQLPLVLGSTVRDWWINRADEVSTPAARPVWEGSTPGAERLSYRLALFLTTWDNPEPERELTHLDYVSALTPCAPFLVAITAE